MLDVLGVELGEGSDSAIVERELSLSEVQNFLLDVSRVEGEGIILG